MFVNHPESSESSELTESSESSESEDDADPRSLQHDAEVRLAFQRDEAMRGSGSVGDETTPDFLFAMMASFHAWKITRAHFHAWKKAAGQAGRDEDGAVVAAAEANAEVAAEADAEAEAAASASDSRDEKAAQARARFAKASGRIESPSTVLKVEKIQKQMSRMVPNFTLMIMPRSDGAAGDVSIDADAVNPFRIDVLLGAQLHSVLKAIVLIGFGLLVVFLFADSFSLACASFAGTSALRGGVVPRWCHAVASRGGVR